MRKALRIAMAILMIIAFATVKTNITVSLQCFAGAVFAFIGALPYEEGVFNEGED